MLKESVKQVRTTNMEHLTTRLKASGKLDRVVKRSLQVLNIAFYYLVILSLTFVFLYPLLYMVSKSMMQVTDVADATVQWLPKKISFGNYFLAWDSLKFWAGFANSTIISFGSAVLQILNCSLIGYGFARYRFPGYAVCFVLLLFTFLVPPQTIVVPLYLFFSDLGWINTHLPFVVPSMFGHGLKGALFVLIFIQFYRGMPKVLEEAARIDGAGAFRTYWKIMFPIAKPAMLIVFLFSVVWHWNDSFEPNTYLTTPDFYNLSQRLAMFYGSNNQAAETMSQMTSGSIGMAPTGLNQVMAACILTILPILILYLFVQRHFVESVERSGIAGE